MAQLILTRRQLYERVWTTPIDALAPTLGLSGRGLGKLCARNDIPVPPRGYWAKQTAGHRVTRPPLPFPARSDLSNSFAVPSPDSGVDLDEKAETSAVHPLIAFEAEPANRIEVSEDLAVADPRLLAAERPLLKSKRDAAGLIAPPAAVSFIHPSREQHLRALRIVQALLTACEARGFQTSVAREGAWITVLEEPLSVSIVEATKRVAHPITFTEQKLIDRGLGYQVRKHDEGMGGLSIERASSRCVPPFSSSGRADPWNRWPS